MCVCVRMYIFGDVNFLQAVKTACIFSFIILLYNFYEIG